MGMAGTVPHGHCRSPSVNKPAGGSRAKPPLYLGGLSVAFSAPSPIPAGGSEAVTPAGPGGPGARRPPAVFLLRRGLWRRALSRDAWGSQPVGSWEWERTPPAALGRGRADPPPASQRPVIEQHPTPTRPAVPRVQAPSCERSGSRPSAQPAVAAGSETLQRTCS